MMFFFSLILAGVVSYLFYRWLPFAVYLGGVKGLKFDTYRYSQEVFLPELWKYWGDSVREHGHCWSKTATKTRSSKD